MGLGDKVRGGNGDADAPLLILCALTPCVHDTGSHIGDGQHVLVRFSRQTQHEVELHGAVTPCKSGAAGLQKVIQGDILIDDIPEALAACLGSEG